MDNEIRYGVIFLIEGVSFFHMYDGNHIYNGIETILENEYYDKLMSDEIILIVSNSEISFNDSDTNDMIFGEDDNTDEYFDEVLISYLPVLRYRLKTDLDVVDLVDLDLINILIDKLIEEYKKRG